MPITRLQSQFFSEFIVKPSHPLPRGFGYKSKPGKTMRHASAAQERLRLAAVARPISQPFVMPLTTPTKIEPTMTIGPSLIDLLIMNPTIPNMPPNNRHRLLPILRLLAPTLRDHQVDHLDIDITTAANQMVVSLVPGSKRMHRD